MIRVQRERTQAGRLLARALFVAIVGYVQFTSSVALARAELSLRASSNAVEVGDPFDVTLEAVSDDDVAPTAPTLPAAANVRVLGRSVGTSQRVEFGAGGASRKIGIVVTWTLSAAKVGALSLGPAEVSVAGRRQKSNSIRINVVAAGKGPRGGQQAFDPWKGLMFPGLGDDEPDEVAAPHEVYDPQYALPEARAPLVFLHAKLDREKAVVGEQVLLDVFLYEEDGIGDLRFSDVHEISAADFQKRVLSPDEAKPVGKTKIGDKVYLVRLLREVALFPMKAGELDTGSMSLSFSGRNSLVTRESELLKLHVEEAPLKGRPPGYVAGTTGKFQLGCTVQKRDVVQGDATAVLVTLSGTGNLPGSLRPPLAEGVVFLDPEIRDTTAVDQNHRVTGDRTLSYVVRIERDGEVPLGRFTLPFYDASQSRYDSTSCELGNVHASKSPVAAPVKPPHPLADLGAPYLGALPPTPERHFLEGARTAPLLAFSAPSVALLGVLARAAARALARRRQAAADSPAAKQKKAKVALAECLKHNDAGKTLAALSELLVQLIDLHAGPGMRAVPDDQLDSWLIERGVKLGRAARLRTFFARASELRFAPGGATPEELGELVREGEKLARDLA